MDNLKDYVFYVIVKDNDNCYSYGVVKNQKYEHQSYLEILIGIEPYFFEDIDISLCWNKTIESFVKMGNITFVNSSISLNDIDNNLYLLYLPSNPNIYQLNKLEEFIPQLKHINFDVGVYGEMEEEYKNERYKADFNSFEYLKKYIFKNKCKIESTQLVKKAI